MHDRSCSFAPSVAVLVEMLTVVVRTSAIVREYTEGLCAFERDCPNMSFAADAHLARIGFMNGHDVDALVEHLEDRGLRLGADGRCADVALVDAARGLLQPCDWLHLGQTRETGVRFCELASALPTDQVVVYEQWFSSVTYHRNDQGTFESLRPGDGPALFPATDGRRTVHYQPTV
jgi:hypothetical protein